MTRRRPPVSLLWLAVWLLALAVAALVLPLTLFALIQTVWSAS